MSSDLRDIRPSTGLLMGSLFLVSGLAIAFVGLGWIQVDPAKIHAPGWVLGVCGGIFGLLGAGILYYAVVNASEGGEAGAAARSRPGASRTRPRGGLGRRMSPRPRPRSRP